MTLLCKLCLAVRKDGWFATTTAFIVNRYTCAQLQGRGVHVLMRGRLAKGSTLAGPTVPSPCAVQLLVLSSL